MSENFLLEISTFAAISLPESISVGFESSEKRVKRTTQRAKSAVDWARNGLVLVRAG